MKMKITENIDLAMTPFAAIEGKRGTQDIKIMEFTLLL
jgi:hypothetical protein